MPNFFDALGAFGQAASGFSEAQSARTAANAAGGLAVEQFRLDAEAQRKAEEDKARAYKLREMDLTYKLHPEIEEARIRAQRMKDADEMQLVGFERRDYILTGKLPTPKEPRVPKETELDKIEQVEAALGRKLTPQEKARWFKIEPPKDPASETAKEKDRSRREALAPVYAQQFGWTPEQAAQFVEKGEFPKKSDSSEAGFVKEAMAKAFVPVNPADPAGAKRFDQNVFDTLMANARRQAGPVKPAPVSMGDVKVAERAAPPVAAAPRRSGAPVRPNALPKGEFVKRFVVKRGRGPTPDELQRATAQGYIQP